MLDTGYLMLAIVLVLLVVLVLERHVRGYQMPDAGYWMLDGWVMCDA